MLQMTVKPDDNGQQNTPRSQMLQPAWQERLQKWHEWAHGHPDSIAKYKMLPSSVFITKLSCDL
jgi:hypothetical protein